MGWEDSLRKIEKKRQVYSRFYKVGDKLEGARLDRVYHWGSMGVEKIKYLSNSFSDHLSLFSTFTLPEEQKRFIPPNTNFPRKIPPHIVEDSQFREEIEKMMKTYNEILENGGNLLNW